MRRSSGGTGAGSRRIGSPGRPRSPVNVRRCSPAWAVRSQGDHRRAEQVAGVDERRLQTAVDFLPIAVQHDLEAAQQRLVSAVAAVVQRLYFRLAFLPFTVEVGGVLFLDLGRIAEHDGGEGRGRRAEERPAKALADEVRQVAAVVDVGVAEDDGVDVLGAETGTPRCVGGSRDGPGTGRNRGAASCRRRPPDAWSRWSPCAAPQNVTVGSAEGFWLRRHGCIVRGGSEGL